MSTEAPWIALAIDFTDSEMFRAVEGFESATHGEVLAWICLLCWIKAFGRGGRARVVKSDFAARYHLSMRAVEGMLSRAQKCAAVKSDGEFVSVCNWDIYQGKASSAKYRKRASIPETSSTKHQSPSTKHHSPANAGEKPPRTRVPDPIWDVMAELFHAGNVPDSGRSTLGKAVKELKELGATPDDIRNRFAAAKRDWNGKTIRAGWFVLQWGQLGRNGPASQQHRRCDPADQQPIGDLPRW